MDFADAQIEIATLANLERQAERTAAALERVRDLLREVAEMEMWKCESVANTQCQ
jgi:hypothetical protein